MPMLLLMVNMLVARFFGFRHRELDDELSVFRATDVFAGILFPIMGLAAISIALQYLGLTFPARANGMIGGLSLGLIIFVGTTWMPFLEHLSLLSPDEVTARQRRVIVILAQSIPYLYGMIALSLALLLAPLMVGMLGMALIGFATIFGFDPNTVSRETWLWIGGGVSILFALFLIYSLSMSERLTRDWGLPDWARFVEPGHPRPAGELLFGPLDATIGHLAKALTAPSAKDQTAAKTAHEPMKITDFRRYDIDTFDLMIGLIIGCLVTGVILSIGGTILGWLAPGMSATISKAMEPAAPGQTNTISPVMIAVLLTAIIPILLTMMGVVWGLGYLADRSANQAWASHRWVRWLARGAKALHLVIAALLAMILGGFVAVFVGSWLAPHTPWISIFLFAGASLLMSRTFLSVSPNKDSYLHTFIANVEEANCPPEG